MSLRLAAAAIVMAFFALAAVAMGQTPDREARPPKGDNQIERIFERERTGVDPNVASGAPGEVSPGTASGRAAEPVTEEERQDVSPHRRSEPSGIGEQPPAPVGR